MYQAIMAFIRSIGLKSKFNYHCFQELLISCERFASEDNKLILTVTHVCDPKFGEYLVRDQVQLIERINKQGCVHFDYSTFEEMNDMVEKDWEQKLEAYLPYESRVAELFTMLKSPLMQRGIGGKVLNVCFITRDGYHVSFTELETSAEVKDDDIEYLLSGEAIADLASLKA